MPTNISFEEAAASTLAALTALQVLQPRVKKGDKVLIHAGSGGVGHFAIQIAKHLGARVTTTSSARNKDFVLSLGADEHIDYREQRFEEVTSDIDLVLDGMGGEVLVNSLKVVKDGGQVVSLPTPEFPESVKVIAEQGNIDVSFLLVQSSGTDMNTLKGMLESGVLKPHVSKVFSFEEIAMLQEIQSAVFSDQKELSDNLKGVRNSISGITDLRQILNDPPPEYDDSFKELFGSAYGIHVTVLNTASYEALKARGLDRISNDELRFRIIELYDDSYKRIESINEIEFKINLDILRPYYYEHFSDIRFKANASPLDYHTVVRDATYRNMIDYRLLVLEWNQGEIYEKTLSQISKVLEMLTKELGDG